VSRKCPVQCDPAIAHGGAGGVSRAQHSVALHVHTSRSSGSVSSVGGLLCHAAAVCCEHLDIKLEKLGALSVNVTTEVMLIT
jgi:hypothetical protein